MNDKSNYQVKAYEFVCLLTISEEFSEFRSVSIIKNRGYSAA